jgi:hypothetical protein
MLAEVGQALSDLGGTVDWTAPADQALLVRPRPTLRKIAAIEAPRPTTAPAPAPARAESTATPARRGSLAAGLGAAVLVALVATGTWLWWRPAPPTVSPPPPPLPSPAATDGTETPAVAPLAAAAAPATTPVPTLAATRPASTPAATPTPTATPTPAATAAAAPGLDPEARLARADDLVKRGRWAEALAEARAVLEAQPTNARATALAQQAEAEVVIDQCLKNARAALLEGDRDRAFEEVRRGFMVRANDPRLLAMHREIAAQQ